MTQRRHAYLGDLEDVAHPQPCFFVDGEIVTLPLIFLRETVLFPGEELPLRMLSDQSIESIRGQLSSDGALLAVLCPGQEKDAIYGTTVRVERFNVADNCASITGAAKQRFRLLKVRSGPDGLGAFGDVEIQADLPPPRMPFPVYTQQWRSSSDDATHKRRRHTLSRSPCFWSVREYELFDAHALVRRIRQIMIGSAHCNWFQRVSTQQPRDATLLSYLADDNPQDPIRFAYWIAANLPLDHHERLELLKSNSIVRLLRREIAILEKLEENIYCASCHTFLSQTREIFSMTSDGVAGTFVNPGGVVHQIMTLREVHDDHVYVDAARSTQDSWFPGYAWSVAYCRLCYNFLGWQFNRVESVLQPETFYGFRRTALTQSQPVEQDGEGEDGMWTDEEEYATASEESEDATLLME